MSVQSQNNISINRCPRIMIHTCNKREWYVYQFLIPSLIEQGIKKQQIIVWHDYERVGNLHAFLKSCDYIKNTYDPNNAIWHLQDDVLVSANFKQEIEKQYDGIVDGFVCDIFNKGVIDKTGRVPMKNLWYSFPCIRIPNVYCGQFYDWIYEEAIFKNDLFLLFIEGKHDDELFMTFLRDKHFREYITNLNPNLVEHIDYMIGWSIANQARGKDIRNAYYWREPERTRELARKLKEAGKYVN